MKNRLARLWYRFKNWFRTKSGPGEPLTFLCGSEEELRRVTTWICHIHPHIYPSDRAIRIAYVSSTKRERGHAQALDLGALAQNLPVTELSQVIKGCRIVFDCNEFSGTEWVNGPPGEQAIHVPEMMVSPEHIGLSAFTGIYEKPIYLEVITKSPSAQEHAESLLSLSEWLDGKVSEQEKRELLQVV